MSINWNKEIEMKDVKKFFNQEIKLGEVDFNKRAQVATLIVAFGVIPAFTYGTVLGTLEGERIALMGEVSSLRSSMVGAASSAFASSTNVRLDKTEYSVGDKAVITFPSDYKGLVKIELYDYKGIYLQQALGTTSSINGNTFTWVTGGTLNDTIFTVKVTEISTGRSMKSGKFYIYPQVTIMASSTPMTQATTTAYFTGVNSNTGEISVGQFMLRANGDAITITKLPITIRKPGYVWSPQTYVSKVTLYDSQWKVLGVLSSTGTFPVVNGSQVAFVPTNFRIEKDSQKLIKVFVELKNLTSAQEQFNFFASTSLATMYSKEGGAIKDDTRASGIVETKLKIQNIGPQVTINSKTITVSGTNSTSTGGPQSTSTVTARFNVTIKAIGSDLIFGTQASTSPMFSYTIYDAWNSRGILSNLATSSSFAIPTNAKMISTNSFIVEKSGDAVTLDLSVSFEGKFKDGKPLLKDYQVSLNVLRATTPQGKSVYTYFYQAESPDYDYTWYTNTIRP